MVMIRGWTVDLQTRQELLELKPISFLKKTYIVQHFSLGNLAAKQQISVGYFNPQGMAGFILPWIGEKRFLAEYSFRSRYRKHGFEKVVNQMWEKWVDCGRTDGNAKEGIMIYYHQVMVL